MLRGLWHVLHQVCGTISASRLVIGLLFVRARILVQVTINRRLLIGRDGHLDQSEAYDLS